MTDDPEVKRSHIRSAHSRVSPYIRRTPTLDLGKAISNTFSLTLKLDNLQPTGSFKVRGAFSTLTAASIPERGVAAASGGNFGLAIAYGASRLGHSATIFVPGYSPAEKIERIREQGADVRVIEGYYDQALAACEQWVTENDVFVAHAYDQPEVVAGQGTAGLEILDQVPDADVVLVAVGGGGLIAGVASWVRDDAGVVAVEPALCRSFNAAVEAGTRVEVVNGGIASSSLATEVIGEHAWAARRWIDDSVVVSDPEIIEAQRWLWAAARLAVEPAAAAPMAALMSGAFKPPPGSRVVALVSGANVNPGSLG